MKSLGDWIISVDFHNLSIVYIFIAFKSHALAYGVM